MTSANSTQKMTPNKKTPNRQRETSGENLPGPAAAGCVPSRRTPLRQIQQPAPSESSRYQQPCSKQQEA